MVRTLGPVDSVQFCEGEAQLRAESGWRRAEKAQRSYRARELFNFSSQRALLQLLILVEQRGNVNRIDGEEDNLNGKQEQPNIFRE